MKITNESIRAINRRSLENFIESLEENPDLLNSIRNMLGGGISFPSELVVKLKKD